MSKRKGRWARKKQVNSKKRRENGIGIGKKREMEGRKGKTWNPGNPVPSTGFPGSQLVVANHVIPAGMSSASESD